jgi:hypothetical protein
MKKTGFIVNDPKLVKIISIASQKFISEIVNDVMQQHKLKSKTSSSGGGAQTTTSASATSMNQSSAVPNVSSSATSSSANNNSQQPSASSSLANVAKSNKTNTNANTGLTLTLEDLSQVLTEYGINVKKPYYFM